MTRKDFQLIADVVKNISDSDARNATAMDFAHRLQSVNPRFNISRIVKACQPVEEENESMWISRS